MYPLSVPSDPFLDQLASLCRDHPTRAKWVFVPSHGVGRGIGARLAREGTSWANLRLVTPLDVAVRMAAPFLLEAGLDPSEETLGPALAMRLLLDLPEEGGYFREMAGHATLAQALWRTLSELRYAGLTATDLTPEAFAQPAKHRELVALVSAYERHLAAAGVADMPMVVDEARSRLDWCPITHSDLVIEAPDTIWPPLVRRLLDVLPGERVAPRALALEGVAVPARMQALACESVRVPPDPARDAGRLAFLQAPAQAPPLRGDGTLDLFHAGGHDAELEEVCRRILASGRRLDEIEIVCASEASVHLAFEKAARLEWKATVSSGIPAIVTRPGRLVRQWFDWVGSGLAASSLRALLQSGDVAPRAFEPDAAGESGALSAGQAARLLLKAQATWGRDTYARALGRLAGEYDREGADEERSAAEQEWARRKAAQTRTLAGWVDGVLGALPVADEAGHVPVVRLAESAVAFLRANAAIASGPDAVALVAIGDALAGLEALGDYRTGVAAALALVEAVVGGLAVLRERPRPGHLHISTLADAGLDGRPLVFIVGLQEGGVFPAAIEDPILLDAERRAISPALRTASDRLDEAVHAGLARLATLGAAAERVTLSFSCRDTREFRETFPSWIVLQAYRLREGAASLTYDDLARALGEPASAVPDGAGLATTAAGWWLASCASHVRARPWVLEVFPALAAGERAEAARASDVLTEFDGYVEAAAGLLDPTRTGRSVSASALERAAQCPFRFFLEQALGVRPIEEAELEADAWLTPMLKGSELHALFARLMRTLRAESRPPELRRDGRRLRRWGEERLRQIAGEMPPPSDEVFLRESRAFLDDLDVFLEAECQGRHGRRPVAFEVAFGSTLDDETVETLSSEAPLAVDLGGGRRLLVRGRIDRINAEGPGTCEVVDYKTGRYFGPAWEGTFAGGTRLQHAIYALGAEHLLSLAGVDGIVIRAVYVFPSANGHRRRKVIERADMAALPRVLRDLVDVIGTGVFVLAGETNACRFCDLAAACHAEDPEAPGADETRAAAKVANTANVVLEPFWRLRGHD
jgi:ATP-dependent helicase/nuclease subunit B